MNRTVLNAKSVLLSLSFLTVTVSGAVARAQHMDTPGPTAQPTPGPAAEARRNYEGVKKNILASAEKMPAADFAYKPEPDVRTFARVLTHITEAQFHSCGAFNGTDQATLKVPDQTAGKEAIVAALKLSFMECDKAYAAFTDANLAELVQAGPAKRSRIGLLWGTNSHDNEQYATLALYLRLKGIVPPSTEK
jgi:hypothetical protein